MSVGWCVPTSSLAAPATRKFLGTRPGASGALSQQPSAHVAGSPERSHKSPLCSAHYASRAFVLQCFFAARASNVAEWLGWARILSNMIGVDYGFAGVGIA